MVSSESSVRCQTLFSDFTVSPHHHPISPTSGDHLHKTLSLQYCCMFKQPVATTRAGSPSTRKTIVNTTYTQSPPATHDPCKITHIPNHCLSLKTSTTITYIRHGIELTGNRTSGVRLYYFILENGLAKYPGRQNFDIFTVLPAHTCTLLHHRSHRHFS